MLLGGSWLTEDDDEDDDEEEGEEKEEKEEEEEEEDPSDWFMFLRRLNLLNLWRMTLEMRFPASLNLLKSLMSK